MIIENHWLALATELLGAGVGLLAVIVAIVFVVLIAAGRVQ